MREEEEDLERADLSVLLLRDERVVISGIDRTLHGLRRGVHAPIVVGYEGRDKLFGGLSDRGKGYMLARGRMDVERLLHPRDENDVMYIFIDMENIAEQILEGVEVILFQEAAVRRFRRVHGGIVYLMILASIWPKLARQPPRGYEDVFEFRQRPGFSALCHIARNDLVMLGERVAWEGAMPYPDTRALEPQHEREFLAAVRAGAEMEPCPHCGSVWPRGTALRLFCGGREVEVAAQLPPAMPQQLPE
jgi:hypothetical protein